MMNKTNLTLIRKENKKKKGFTLIELIVVIAILGILAAIAIPRFSTVTGNANRRATEANHKTIISAVKLYQAQNDGALPDADADLTPFLEGGLAALQDKPATGCSYTITYTDANSITLVSHPTSGADFSQTLTRD